MRVYTLPVLFVVSLHVWLACFMITPGFVHARNNDHKQIVAKDMAVIRSVGRSLLMANRTYQEPVDIKALKKDMVQLKQALTTYLDMNSENGGLSSTLVLSPKETKHDTGKKSEQLETIKSLSSKVENHCETMLLPRYKGKARYKKHYPSFERISTLSKNVLSLRDLSLEDRIREFRKIVGDLTLKDKQSHILSLPGESVTPTISSRTKHKPRTTHHKSK